MKKIFFPLSILIGFLIFIYFFASIFTYQGERGLGFLSIWARMIIISIIFLINIIKRKKPAYILLYLFMGIYAIFGFLYILFQGEAGENFSHHIFSLFLFFWYAVSFHLYKVDLKWMDTTDLLRILKISLSELIKNLVIFY